MGFHDKVAREQGVGEGGLPPQVILGAAATTDEFCKRTHMSAIKEVLRSLTDGQKQPPAQTVGKLVGVTGIHAETCVITARREEGIVVVGLLVAPDQLADRVGRLAWFRAVIGWLANLPRRYCSHPETASAQPRRQTAC